MERALLGILAKSQMLSSAGLLDEGSWKKVLISEQRGR